jgi:hypothetical protein
MPNDKGYFSLNEEERRAIIAENPEVKKVIKPFMGADEFINNIPRYCIWLKDTSPASYEKSKVILNRIKNIRKARMESDREATRKLAEFPTLFGEIRQPDTDYLLIPRVSSKRRKYIPIGFLNKDVIAGDSTSVIPNATLYDSNTMIPELVKAHQKLDKAVEAAYGRSFDDDGQRVAYLFELYQKLSGELFVGRRGRGR